MTDLHQALEDALFLFPYEDEGSSERYDRVTDKFHEETGVMAPGRSIPLEAQASQPSHAERHDLYEAWCAERVEQAREALEVLGSLLRSVDSLIAHYDEDEELNRVTHKHVESVEEKMPPRSSLYPGGGEV